MTTRLARSSALVLTGGIIAATMTAPAAGTPAGPTAGVAEPRLVPADDLVADHRAPQPQDRYEMARGCYVIRALDADAYVRRTGPGFVADAAEPGAAEPFHFQATDLGSYLLFGSAGDFLSAEPGILEVVDDLLADIESNLPVTRDTNLTRSLNDDLPDLGTLGVQLPNTVGDTVVSTPEPSPAADWEVEQRPDGWFTLRLPATGTVLTAAADGVLRLASDAAAEASPFAFELADDCAPYPEIDLDVAGAPVRGETPYAEVRGYLDAHLHTMAYEFLGGRARCGQPWHRYGVAYAMVDCPDHEPGGHGAVLENVLSHGTPVASHDTAGWPTFRDWPAYDSLTHEGIYYRWLERAWRGGLRMMTTLLVDNNVLCEVYPYKQNSCNEMDGVRLQARRLHEFQDYIDAQHGGPGKGWLRIVTDPHEARDVVNQGKLAVVMGIEVSVLFDCGEVLEQPQCDRADITRQIEEVHALGVRQMELLNKFDSALAGVKGDAGTTGILVNHANFLETGHFWKMQTCDDPEGHGSHAHDHTQYNLGDGIDGAAPPPELTGRDSLVGAILQVFGPTGAAPAYPAGPHCNAIGLTDLGTFVIEEMMRLGMIFDPDHMSAKARDEAMDVIEAAGYSGVVSSHGWADDTIYPRVYRAGGVVTPYAGDSTEFVEKWRQHRAWADPRYYFGFGYGADMNGFGAQGGPRGADVEDPVVYPFSGFGGVTVDRHTSGDPETFGGERVWDINRDGVAHYGMYPDWIEDLRILAGDDGPELLSDLARGPEAYLQTWERAEGIAPDACHSERGGIDRKQLKHLRTGMTPREVLEAVGQPASRIGTEFAYCVAQGNRVVTATVTFDDQHRLEKVATTRPGQGSAGSGAETSQARTAPTPGVTSAPASVAAPPARGTAGVGGATADDHDHAAHRHGPASATLHASPAAAGTGADALRALMLLAALAVLATEGMRRRRFAARSSSP